VVEHLRFASARDDIQRARTFVRDTLQSVVDDSTLEDAVLATSELVTNAVTHAGTSGDLVVSTGRARVRIEVRDHSSELPVLHHATPEEQHGRGLALIDALSARWGVSFLPKEGKAVWCELDRTRT
jgi:anti-sigma regulatory factor (Ser/Thr protein kinase)